MIKRKINYILLPRKISSRENSLANFLQENENKNHYLYEEVINLQLSISTIFITNNWFNQNLQDTCFQVSSSLEMCQYLLHISLKHDYIHAILRITIMVLTTYIQ